MTSSERPRRDVERNHAAILTAAIAVLANSPQATMADIAHASGIGRSTLYRHFPDREALIMAIYARILAEAETIVTQWLPGEPGDDPVAVLAGLCTTLAEIGDRYRFLQLHQPKPGKKDPSRMRRSEEALTSYLSAHQQSGQIRDDLPTDWLVAMLASVTMRASRHPSLDDRARLVHATVTSLLRPAAGQTGA